MDEKIERDRLFGDSEGALMRYAKVMGQSYLEEGNNDGNGREKPEWVRVAAGEKSWKKVMVRANAS